MGITCRICVEVLENGYEVEIPDLDALNKANAEYEKDKSKMRPYAGDFTKSYAAKTVNEVLKLVTPALKNLPQTAYDQAFDEASKESST